MKNNKLLTVSIGTSAYNEVNNIKSMLLSVIGQKEEKVKIEEVIVISDGSTDSTAKVAESVKDNRIKIIDDGKRMGKATRINLLLKMFRGDVLVIVDSDMLLKNKIAIENMTKKFIEDKTTALVCGNAQPVSARNFLESTINNYIFARNSLDKKFSFGDTAYSAHGLLAYSKTFARTLSIPKKIINDDTFSYFMCLSKGFKYYFAKNGVVLYRSPSSIKDHIYQSIRHLAGGFQLYDYFGKEVVDKGFYVPGKIKLKLLLYQLKRNPLGYVFLKILNLYCAFRSKNLSKNFDIRWDEIRSSKRPIL